ncbi:hypothetical protein [Methanoculleus chikugoensis]|uniref:hypothetical protein n=1 Tax=Methanoculleus chikugoensis TaxID=118126 RepID=UPI001FB20ACE|nr:hypothetical protein [Methanoculleus chikugoensis]
MTGRISPPLCLLLALFFAASAAVPGATAAQGGTMQTEIRCNFPPGEVIEAGDTAVFDLAVTNRGDIGTCSSTTGRSAAPTTGRSGSRPMIARSTGC